MTNGPEGYRRLAHECLRMAVTTRITFWTEPTLTAQNLFGPPHALLLSPRTGCIDIDGAGPYCSPARIHGSLAGTLTPSRRTANGRELLHLFVCSCFFG